VPSAALDVIGGQDFVAVEKVLHIGNLLPLLDDWAMRFRRSLPPYLNCTSANVDRALMVGDHHACKVAVGVTTRRYLHAYMHAIVRVPHLPVE
jgi:hypothetical protein